MHLLSNALNIFSYSFFILFFTLGTCELLAQESVAKGTVYLDTNKNGQKESFEKGLPRVKVSNGLDVVKTDKNGNYHSIAVIKRLQELLANVSCDVSFKKVRANTNTNKVTPIKMWPVLDAGEAN